MLIEGFPAQVAATNCYVLATGRGEQCLIVDPGVGVAAQLDEVLAEHRLHPVAVLLTHGHIDHMFSVFPVCQAKQVPAYIHAEDRSGLTDPWSMVGATPGEPMFGLTDLTFAEPADVHELADGQTLQIAGIELTVRHAPGHTRGSVVFSAGDAGNRTGSEAGGDAASRTADDPGGVLLSGDVLFAGSIGRTDLPGGSMSDMVASLRQVILPMADQVAVYPGHGPQTTIGRERTSNPFLTDDFLAGAR